MRLIDADALIEAIANAREVAEEIRENIIDGDNLEPYESYCNAMVDKSAEEHEQLAEWLEELKALRHEANEWRKAGYSHGYNKAIDDYKYLLSERLEAGRCVDEKFAYIDLCDIDEIAEQLKAGGENERNTFQSKAD